MSGLKYHGGMKGLYAMLALTEASLVDDDVDTTPVRAKKRQDHEDEGQVTIHMRTRLGGGVRIWPSIKLRCRTTGTESKFIHAVGLSPFPDMDAGGTGRGVHAPLRSPSLQLPCLRPHRGHPSARGTRRGRHRAERQGCLPVGNGLKSGDDVLRKGRPQGRPFSCARVRRTRS